MIFNWVPERIFVCHSARVKSSRWILAPVLCGLNTTKLPDDTTNLRRIIAQAHNLDDALQWPISRAIAAVQGRPAGRG